MGEEEEKAPHSLTHSHKKRSMLMPPLEREGFLALSLTHQKAAHSIMYIFGGKGGAGGKLPHAKILFDYFSVVHSACQWNSLIFCSF